MFTLLPFVVLTFLSLIFYQKDFGFRVSLLLGAIFWGTILTFIVELLSIFNILTYNWLLVVWILIFFALFIYYRLIPKRNSLTFKSIIFFKKGSFWSRILFLLVFVIVASIFVIAIVAAPNNGDSL
ncbi:MAG: hypothetical protein ACD_7C00536G0001, partial [uncultured bacterium]